MAVKALMNVLLMGHICVGLYVAVKTLELQFFVPSR